MQRLVIHASLGKLLVAQLSGVLRLVPIENRHFSRGAEPVGSDERGLRASDALFLALAVDHRPDLATHEDDCADVAISIGVKVDPIT